VLALLLDEVLEALQRKGTEPLDALKVLNVDHQEDIEYDLEFVEEGELQVNDQRGEAHEHQGVKDEEDGHLDLEAVKGLCVELQLILELLVIKVVEKGQILG